MVEKFYDVLRVWLKSWREFWRKEGQAGFTLIELMAVITILGVMATIAVPSVMATIEKSKQDVCEVNMDQLERMYNMHLVMEGIEHSDEVFNQYIVENDYDECPIECDPTYVDGEVMCSEHIEDEGNVDENVDEGTEDVPYL